MATLYDKSLDQFLSNSWNLGNFFSLNYTSVNWESPDYSGLGLSWEANIKPFDVELLSFSRFDSRFLEDYDTPDAYFYSAREDRMVSMTRAVKSMALAKESSMNEVVKVGFGPTKETKAKFTAPVVKKDEEIKQEKDEPKNVCLLYTSPSPRD